MKFRYQYICRKIEKRFAANCVLEENIWKTVKKIDLVENDGNKLCRDFATNAQMCWDDVNLYIRFNCKDSYRWATMKYPGQPLWKEEVVEVFIDPEKNGKNYVEIEVNPLNNVLALLILNVEQKSGGLESIELKLKSLKTNVAANDSNWVVDIVIPFENFAHQVKIPPRENDVWRLNLYRIERPIKDNPQDCVLIAWSPTFSDTFHRPQYFGEIIFKS